MEYMKITQRLVLGFLTVSLLIGFVGYVSINASQKVLQKSIGENSVMLARETLDKIDRDIYHRIERWRLYCLTSPRIKEIISLSNREFERFDNIQAYIDKREREWVSAQAQKITPFMESLINNELSQELRERIDFYRSQYGYNVIVEFFITNKYGANVAQTGRTTDYYQADEEWWQTAREDGLSVGDVEYDRGADVYSIDIGVRIDDEDGNFLGIAKAVLNIEDILGIINEVKAVSEYKSMNIELVTNDGRPVCAEEYKISDAALRILSEFKQGKRHIDYFIIKQPGQRERLFVHAHSKGYRSFKTLGWILIIEYETKEIFAPIAELRNVLLLISLIVTIVAILLGLLISRSISAPIIKLKDAMGRIGGGKLDTKIEINSGDEIGDLAMSFNRMVGDLKETTISKDYMDNIVSSLADMLIVITPDGRIERVNKAVPGILKYDEEELIGKDVNILFSNKEGVPFGKIGRKKLVKEGVLKGREIDFESKDGRQIPVLLSCAAVKDKEDNVISIVCVAKDISERKKMERALQEAYAKLKETQSHLIQAGKMEAIGRMASGVAHEVKNPLGIVLQSVNYLESELPQMEERYVEILRIIKDNIKRADNIIRALVDFSRATELKLKPEDINVILQDSLALIKHRVKLESITVIKELEEGLPKILADRGKMEQVFVNIFLNSIYAMPNGGKLFIRTYSTQLNKIKFRVGRRKRDGDYFEPGERAVVVEIEDTGSGIPKERLQKVFDPFFTTKGIGEGAGLGLTVTRNIIDLHKGIINIESEEGKGTSVIITLKVSKE